MIYQIKFLDISYSLYPIVSDKYYGPLIIDSSFLKGYERYQISGDMNKELSLNDYLNTIRSNVEELLNRQKVIDTKNVQLSISTIFLNCLTNETTEKFIYSHNFELRSTDDKKEKETKLFNSLLKRFQEILENKIEGSSFVFDYVNFLHIKFQQIDLIRGSSYIKSPKWMQNKQQLIKKSIIKINILCML